MEGVEFRKAHSALMDGSGAPALASEASFAYIGEQLAGGSALLSPAQYTGTRLLYIIGQRMLRSLSVYCSGF